MKAFKFVLPFFNLLFLPYPAVVNAFSPNPKKKIERSMGNVWTQRWMMSWFWLCFMWGQRKLICTFNILSPKDETCEEIGRVMLLFSKKQSVKIKSRVDGKQKLFLPSIGSLHKEWWIFLILFYILEQVRSDTRLNLQYIWHYKTKASHQSADFRSKTLWDS